MPTACPACHGPLAGPEIRCPHCDLHLGPPGDPAASDADVPPGLLPPGLAGPPMPVPDAAPIPETFPALAHARAGWMKPFAAAAGALAAVLLVGAVAVTLVSRTSPPPAEAAGPLDRIGKEMRACLARAVVRDAPPSPLPDEILARRRQDAPEAWSRAAARHVPFQHRPGQSLHAFFDAYVHRRAELDPDFAFGVGRHPHPTALTPEDDETAIGLLLLDRDAWTSLTNGSAAEALSLHERTDARRWRDLLELDLAWGPERDSHWKLAAFPDLFHRIEVLRVSACCPAPGRLRAAAATLREIARRADGLPALPADPPRVTIQSLRRRLTGVESYLEQYPSGWKDGDPGGRADLAEACRIAQDALGTMDRRLGAVPASTRHPPVVGRDNLLRLIQAEHLGSSPETLAREAIDEFVRAATSLRDGAPARPEAAVAGQACSLNAEVLRLRARTDRWVSPGPASDPGLAVTTAPPFLSEFGCYIGRAAMGPPMPGVVLSSIADTCDVDARHTAAHEAYPGHHLQALLAGESACALRRTLASPALVEGWAEYATDLLHESGNCAGTAEDEAVSANERVNRALLTGTELLLHAGQATPEQVHGWLKDCWGETYATTVLEEFAGYPDQVYYFAGHREVRRIIASVKNRAGAAFDAPACHDRLLRLGPLPPALLEDELQ